MLKASGKGWIIRPFLMGIVLGITAKLVDVPDITCRFPIFDDIMGRFGIWVWAAALIAILSRGPVFAAVRSFAFFAGMLSAYYGYTVRVLRFFPGSQILLWSGIALVTPFCGFVIWQVHRKRHSTDLTASLPFVIFFTEWYLTGREDRLLLLSYLCMTVSLSAVIPTGKKRLFGLLYGLLLSAVLIWLVQAGIVVNLYERLLNI